MNIRQPLPHAGGQPDHAPAPGRTQVSLLQRRARAETERWLGEIAGIDLTLQFLCDKRDRAAG
jgi:hypothetical protein